MDRIPKSIRRQMRPGLTVLTGRETTSLIHKASKCRKATLWW